MRYVCKWADAQGTAVYSNQICFLLHGLGVNECSWMELNVGHIGELMRSVGDTLTIQ